MHNLWILEPLGISYLKHLRHHNTGNTGVSTLHMYIYLHTSLLRVSLSLSPRHDRYMQHV